MVVLSSNVRLKKTLFTASILRNASGRGSGQEQDAELES